MPTKEDAGGGVVPKRDPRLITAATTRAMAPIVEVQIAALTLDSLGIGTLYPRDSLSSRFLRGGGCLGSLCQIVGIEIGNGALVLWVLGLGGG